ncbi:MAG: hypothetical protein L3K17_02690 [Thermoplasmata archaeon]|nr:hypothetical protein [Thermoplasmata archaeon]
MHDSRLGRWLPARRQGRILSVVIAAAVVALMMVPSGSLMPLASAPPTRDPSAVQSPLSQAEASLTLPVGPSAVYGACAVTAASQVSCGSAFAPHPAVTSSIPPKTWTDLSPYAGTAPAARWLGAMVYDPVDHYVLLFGGYSLSGLFADTWAFSHDTWTQLSPSSAPSGRYAAAIAWDVTDGYAVLFGGTTGATTSNGDFNDTWTFVGGQWTNVTPVSPTSSNNPPSRWREAMTWDAADGYVLMFGGTNAGATTTPFADTWAFSKGVWKQLNVSGSPPGRFRASMAYDAVDGYAVLFGGCTSSSCPDSSTWTYKNLTWTQLSLTTHPSSRVYYGITYSTVYNRVILFGGDTSTAGPTGAQSDTWSFTNGTWTSITANLTRSPVAVSYMMMSFDPLDNITIMFGGEWSNSTYSQTTWGLGPSILGLVTPSPGTIDLTQSLQINATPISYANYVSFDYTLLPPGCVTLNQSVLTCQPASAGTFPIAVVLNDSSGTPVNETTNVTVNPLPTVASFSVTPTTVTRGTPAHFIAAGASGTKPYSYHYSNLPPGCSSSNTATYTCTPGSGASGPYTVVVTITDVVGKFANGTTSLFVNPVPSITSFVARPATLDVGQTLTLYTNISGGTAPFTYGYVGLPNGCSSANASVVTCMPTALSTGPNVVTASVTDLFGWNASQQLTVTISIDPSISGATITPSPVDAGTSIEIQVNASGGTGQLTYSYTTPPPGCSVGNHSSITCIPSSPGTFTVTAIVTDAVGFSVSKPMTVVVNPAYTLVALNATPAAVDEGQNVTINLDAVGGTAPFTYTWTGLPTGCVGTATSPSLTCAPRSTGTFTVAVSGADHWKETASSGVQLIVYPDPAITSFTASAPSVTAGSPVTLSVSLTGGSGAFAFVYHDLPAGCTSTNGSTLTCTPTSPNSYNISVTATDSNGKSATSFVLLTVTAAATSNSASSFALYAGLGVLVLVVILAIALVMMRRRKPPAAAPAAPEKWAEDTE